MKCLFIGVFLTVCLAIAPPAHAQAPPVQSCNGAGSFGGVTSANCFFGSAVSAGNFIILSVEINDTVTTGTSAIVGACATLTQVTGSPFQGTGVQLLVYAGFVTISSACGTGTVHFSGNASGTMTGAEYAGVLSPIASSLDCASAVASGNGTAIASNACTTGTSAGSQSASMTASATGQWVAVMLAYKFKTEPQDILIGLGGTLGNNSTFTAGGSFTVENSQNSSARGSSAIEDFNVGTPDPVISPANPVIQSGGGTTFSCASSCGGGGTFSLVSGTGSINSGTGVYTASGSVTAQQSYAGMQLLPNNHIFNTNISGLPTRSDSATIIAATSQTFNYFWSIPVNYITSSTPSVSLVAQYTPQNNGSYQVSSCPTLLIQDGCYDAQLNGNSDHHFINIRTDTGAINEGYQLYTIGLNAGCLTCNTQSMIKYNANDYALPSVSTNAGGTADLPILLKVQEIETACSTSATINHMVWLTMANGSAHNAFLWPGTTSANAGAGPGFYGQVLRLKSTFAIGSFSACAQKLLTQLKNYGLIFVDGSSGTGNFQGQVEFANAPASVWDALKEVTAANIAPSNFEVVDLSSIEVNPSSGVTTLNRENVCFTRTSDSRQGCTDIVLQGVAVNMQDNQLFVMAGTPAENLVAFVSGNSNTSLTWTMSPTVGSINSSTGAYTAPTSIGSPTATTVTATSVANAAVSAQMTITVFPASGMYMLPASLSNYTDSHSNVWTSVTGLGMSNIPNVLGCCQNDPSFPAITDAALWNRHLESSITFGDYRMESIRAPAGTYTLTFNHDTLNNAVGSNIKYFWLQGSNVATIDETSVAGGQNLPFTFSRSVVVGADNKLSFLNMNIGGEPGNQGGGISSFSLTPQIIANGTFFGGGATLHGGSIH